MTCIPLIRNAFVRFSVILLLSICFSKQALGEENTAESEPMTAEDAIDIADEKLSSPAGSFKSLLRVVETNSESFVVGLPAVPTNPVRPPLPDAPYCLRIWVDRSTRQIIPSPALLNQPQFTVSNIVDILRKESPRFSYGTNEPVAVAHLSETTIARFPAKKPSIPPGYGWLGPDFTCIVWIDNCTSNILFWLEGN